MIAVLFTLLSGAGAFAGGEVVPGCEPGVHQASANASTPLALLYAHGFSACPMEIEPVFSQIGADLGANTLKILFSGHGIRGSEGLRGVHAEDWREGFASGLDALSRLGKKRVVIATSTGASIALENLSTNPGGADALVLISPNFGVKHWEAELLLLPWGLAEIIVHFVLGDYREWTARNEEHARYWTTKYPTPALIEMMKTVRLVRNAPLENIKIPTLVLYCENDYVLDIASMKKHVNRIGAPARMIQAPCDEDTHVLAGGVLAPRSSEKIRSTIVEFLQGI